MRLNSTRQVVFTVGLYLILQKKQAYSIGRFIKKEANNKNIIQSSGKNLKTKKDQSNGAVEGKSLVQNFQ